MKGYRLRRQQRESQKLVTFSVIPAFSSGATYVSPAALYTRKAVASISSWCGARTGAGTEAGTVARGPEATGEVVLEADPTEVAADSGLVTVLEPERMTVA